MKAVECDIGAFPRVSYCCRAAQTGVSSRDQRFAACQPSRDAIGVSAVVGLWLHIACQARPGLGLSFNTPEDAQYWDALGTSIAYVKITIAAHTGTRPNMGENRKVAMR